MSNTQPPPPPPPPTTAAPPPPPPPPPKWSRATVLRSSYKDLGTPTQVGQRFQNYLLGNPSTLASVLSILTSRPTTTDGKTRVKDYSLPIDVHQLMGTDPVLGYMLLRHPTTLLPLLEDSVVAAQREVALAGRRLERSRAGGGRGGGGRGGGGERDDCWSLVKGDVSRGDDSRVHARLTHLPPHSSSCRPLISSLTSLDVGKILQLSGTVVRVSKVQMYESQRAFRCCAGESAGAGAGAGGAGGRWKRRKKEDGCGACFVVKADLQQWNNALCAPLRCPTPSCKGTNFQVIPDGSTHSDYQEIKIQEMVSHRSLLTSPSSTNSRRKIGGIIPRALLVKLQHDLVDRCQPGDDVVIVGTLLAHWQSDLVSTVDMNITTAVHANSIRVVHGAGGDGGGGAGSGGGEHEGSSWDCIFEQDRAEVDEDGDEDGRDGDGKRGKVGMVREEIVKEFRDFWNEDDNRKHPMGARNFICQSVCTTLYGMSLVKLGLLLTLIGGSRNAAGSTSSESHTGKLSSSSQPQSLSEVMGDSVVERGKEEKNQYGSIDGDDDAPLQFHLGDDNETTALPNGDGQKHESQEDKRGRWKSQPRTMASSVQTRRREQSHLLLFGDPGTGKSQFLRFAAALCPRSVLTSGAGTTSAGLTCAAVREGSGKEFTLEAGALVLADRGVCAIDEFGCMDAKDRTTIHEAMEQQTLSVAKAGIVCRLNCRATVIAVTNAKGGIYDHDKTFTSNVGIEPPLLSRFDLIFKLIDGSDPSKDDNVATFLLNRAIQGSGYECAKKVNCARKKESWTIDKLRAYIATVKSQFHPSLSEDASQLLERHYSACRSSVGNELQVTVRFLESLIRLAQAHARLMHRGVVELDDAVSVIILMESTVASCTFNSCDNNSLFQDPTITVFPEFDRADIEFLCGKERVLEKYQMQNLLNEDERQLLVEEKKRFQDSNDHGRDESWNSIINQDDPTIIVDNTMPPSNEVRQCENTQDHYGRCTQISPSFRSVSHYSGKQDISSKSYITQTNLSPRNLSYYTPSQTQDPVDKPGNVGNESKENVALSNKAVNAKKRRSAD